MYENDAYESANEKTQRILNDTCPSAADYYGEDTAEMHWWHWLTVGGPVKFFAVFVAVALIALVAVQFAK